MSFFGWKGSNDRSEGNEHAGRNLQDGLFQIASQACHILVQVNNTHNVSYGGNNSVRNFTYTKCSGKDDEDTVCHATSSSASKGTNSTVKSYTKYKERGKDQDVIVLLPHRKSRTSFVKNKLSTVSEKPAKWMSGAGSVAAGGPNSNSVVPDDDYDVWDHSGFMLKSEADDGSGNGKWRGAQGWWCRPSCIPITVILILIVLVVLLPLLDHTADKYSSGDAGHGIDSGCMNDCHLSFVETLPIGMNYSGNYSASGDTTYDSWAKLITLAQERIEIASFYWTMRREDVYPDDSAKQGEEIFRMLLEAGRDRNVRLRIAQNMPSQISPNVDTEILAKKANAEVRSLNFAGLLGGGVLHTKLWLVDRKHVYVGSANMDWRSLSQVKELGLLMLNCTCLANDYAKIFDVYWTLGDTGKVPVVWPDSLGTKINAKHPMNFTYMGNRYRTYVASAPPPFSPKGRTNDLDAILRCIERAERFIYVALMDYFPLTVYTPKIRYWPVIDNALRTAAVERKVHVRLLISWWKHSRKSEDSFLESLVALSDSYAGVKIEVKRFVVPTDPDYERIPYSRVNHNKYMVTEEVAYVGTSNWSGDYFIDTAGVGTVFESVGEEDSVNLRQRLEDIFHRDWNSKYSRALNESLPDPADDDYYPRWSRYTFA